MATKQTKKHFLLSMVFFVLTLLFFLVLIGVYLIVGYPITSPLIGSILTVVTLVLIERENIRKELRKGKWLWSILFAAIVMEIALYMTQTAYTVIALASTLTSIIGLTLLIREKYIY